MRLIDADALMYDLLTDENPALPRQYCYPCAEIMQAIRSAPTIDNDVDSISRYKVMTWLDMWEGYIDADIIARMKSRVKDIPLIEEAGQR